MYKDKKKRQSYGKLYRKKHRAELLRLFKIYYREHRDELLLYAKQRVRKRKLEICLHYCKGRVRCQCLGCSVTYLGFLQVDHIKGDGRKFRKKGVSGNAFYDWLKRHNFPKGFQILCACCNFSKKDNHRCELYGRPH